MIAELQNGYLISNSLLVYLIEDESFKEIHYLYMSIIKSNSASCLITESELEKRGFSILSYLGSTDIYFGGPFSDFRIFTNGSIRDRDVDFLVDFHIDDRGPLIIQSLNDLDWLIKIWTTKYPESDYFEQLFIKTHKRYFEENRHNEYFINK